MNSPKVNHNTLECRNRITIQCYPSVFLVNLEHIYVTGLHTPFQGVENKTSGIERDQWSLSTPLEIVYRDHLHEKASSEDFAVDLHTF